MKKILTILMIFSLSFLTSCFKKEEEKVNSGALNTGKIEETSTYKTEEMATGEIEEKNPQTSETNSGKIEKKEEIKVEDKKIENNSHSNEKENLENVEKDEKIDKATKEMEDQINDLIDNLEIFTSEKN